MVNGIAPILCGSTAARPTPSIPPVFLDHKAHRGADASGIKLICSIVELATSC